MKILRYLLLGGVVMFLGCPSESVHETKYFSKYLVQYEESYNSVLGIRVVERGTHKPLSKALVSFPGSDLETGYTDESGMFVTTVPPATYVIKVYCPGYYSSGDVVHLKGNTAKTVEFLLSKRGVKKANPSPKPPKPKTLGPISIYFEIGQSYIQPSYYSTLNHAAHFLRENPSTKAEIRGYTDIMGEKSTDLSLPLKRAETVRNYLMGLAVEPSRLIITQGYDQSSSPYSPLGQGFDRRVDIIFSRVR